uniref:CCAAT-binding factor domain-containing protein n=1 Tax=Timema monikensis TaxID=170555 RepID=A0A7R9HP84_9NEOP|nr:unnamed protein product [Timema monikensis]
MDMCAILVLCMAYLFYSVLYKKLADTQLSSSRHHAMFLSLLFKALKADNQIGRTKAFVKRILQVCQYMPVPLACGMLCLISQIVHKRAHLLSLKMETNFADDDGDEEYEHYDDIKIEQDPGDLIEADNADVKMLEDVNTATRVNKTATWFHSHNLSHSEKTKNGQRSPLYTPYQRNPVFAGAEYCTYTELLTLTQHFHPTVALFAYNILQNELIHYSGDPLQDFTLARFLDRFVFKNPKKVFHQEQQVNHSQFSRKKNYYPSGAKALSINSAQYLNKVEGSIPVDELFMYRYLNKKRAEGQKVPGDEREDDRDSVASEEFDEMLEGLMGGKNKVDNMDFADEIGTKLAAPSKSNDEESDEDEIEDEDDGADNMDDEEIDDDDDDDDEDIVFDGDDDEEEINFDEMKDDSILDDEFAEILQDAGAAGKKAGGAGALATKDNAVVNSKYQALRVSGTVPLPSPDTGVGALPGCIDSGAVPVTWNCSNIVVEPAWNSYIKYRYRHISSFKLATVSKLICACQLPHSLPLERWDSSQNSEQAIIFCHGYSCDADSNNH